MGRGKRPRTLALLAFLVGSLLGAAVLGFAILGGDGEARSSSFKPAVALHPVAGTFRPDDTTLAECTDGACFEQAYGNVAHRDGPKVALELFARHFGDGSDPACHRIAHTIGSASLARNGSNVASTIAEGSPTCGSGYYHGVLERALVGVRQRTRSALARVAGRLCDDGDVLNRASLLYQCLHGLGHGLMITTGYELPVSLAVCNRLGSEWDRESCKGGVFMENRSSSYGVRSRWLRDDDPVYPCNSVAERDARTCYQLVTTQVIAAIGTDWERIAETCGGVERRWVGACFQSFGQNAAVYTHRDPEGISELCSVARPYGGERACVVFAAMDLTNNFAGGEQASGLCRATAARLRGACFEAIGTIMGRFRTTTAERVDDCRAISAEAADVAACVRGSSAGLPAASP